MIGLLVLYPTYVNILGRKYPLATWVQYIALALIEAQKYFLHGMQCYFPNTESTYMQKKQNL